MRFRSGFEPHAHTRTHPPTQTPRTDKRAGELGEREHDEFDAVDVSPHQLREAHRRVELGRDGREDLERDEERVAGVVCVVCVGVREGGGERVCARLIIIRRAQQARHTRCAHAHTHTTHTHTHARTQT